MLKNCYDSINNNRQSIVYKTKKLRMEHFLELNNLEIEKKELSNGEFIERSQAFSEEYLGLLSGGASTDFQAQVYKKVLAEFDPIIEKTKNLEGKELSGYMVEGYRKSLNKLYEQHYLKAPFANGKPSDDELAHVLRAEKGPFGVPILYTDGFNEELFADDNLSYVSSDMMIENGLPPVAIIYENYNPVEKEQVVIHEISHMVFSLLRRAGVIPSPEGESVTTPGHTTAFELARDEAIAQMAANQNSGGHPDVVRKMKKEGYSDDELSEYQSSMQSFDRYEAEKSGLNFSDAILGVAMARNFVELTSHMNRMRSISTQRAA